MHTYIKLIFTALTVAAASATGCTSTTDLVLALSGKSGYDNNKKDFDILRELVLFAGLEGALGDGSGSLKDVTVFAPWDDAFYRLASNLGYDGGYDEGKIFNFLANGLGGGDGKKLKAVVTNVLLYHVGNEAREFEDFAHDMKVTTLLEAEKIRVDMAEDTSNSDMRMKLKHMADPNVFPYPKIQNRFFDIETCNGYVHVIKDVLVPTEYL